MKVIYKYVIHSAGSQTIQVPREHNFLHVGLDGRGTPSIWMGVNPSAEKIDIEVIVVPTGQPLPRVGDYLGTITDETGLVWHFFTGPSAALNRYTACHYQTRDNDG